MKSNNARTLGSLVSLVMVFMFTVAATPPSCSQNATVQFSDNGKLYSVKLTDLKQWATDQSISTGDARYMKIANMTTFVQKGEMSQYVLGTTLTNYASKSYVDTKVAGVATKADLAQLRTDTGANLNSAAKKSDLAGLVARSELVGCATKSDLNNYATKDQLSTVSSAVQSLASALNLDGLVAQLKDLFTTKDEVAGTYATKAELAAMVASTASQTLPTDSETPAATTDSQTTDSQTDNQNTDAYQYESDPAFDPLTVHWYVNIQSKSQPSFSISDYSDPEYQQTMNTVDGIANCVCPGLPSVNTTGKVNLTLARNQVNGVTLQGSQYQASYGLVELLKHGYDDAYFGIAQLNDGRYFVGKRVGNTVEVIYSNEVSIEGTFIMKFFTRTECVEFSSEM